MFIGTTMSLSITYNCSTVIVTDNDAAHQNAHDCVTAVQSNRRAVMMQTEKMYPSFNFFITSN